MPFINNELSLSRTCAAKNTLKKGLFIAEVSKFCTNPISQNVSDRLASSISLKYSKNPFSEIFLISKSITDSGEVIYLLVKVENTYHFAT